MANIVFQDATLTKANHNVKEGVVQLVLEINVKQFQSKHWTALSKVGTNSLCVAIDTSQQEIEFDEEKKKPSAPVNPVEVPETEARVVKSELKLLNPKRTEETDNERTDRVLKWLKKNSQDNFVPMSLRDSSRSLALTPRQVKAVADAFDYSFNATKNKQVAE